jgi:hypothetical protein
VILFVLMGYFVGNSGVFGFVCFGLVCIVCAFVVFSGCECM